LYCNPIGPALRGDPALPEAMPVGMPVGMPLARPPRGSAGWLLPFII